MAIHVYTPGTAPAVSKATPQDDALRERVLALAAACHAFLDAKERTDRREAMRESTVVNLREWRDAS